MLESADDAAVANWGNGWRMPTADELIPLVNADGSNRVTCTWVYNYNGSGVDGCIFTGNTDGYRDHSIFLPAAGYYDSGYATNNSYHQVTNFAFVWTSSLCEYSSEKAWRLSAGFSGGSAYTDINNYDGSLDGNRYEGLSVRAVR